MTATIIILIVVSLLAIFIIATYNKLIRLRNMVEEGWSGIDVQLKRRANLIPNLLKTVKGVATPPRARFAPFMAVYLLRKHQIFMLAFAGLRVEGEVAQVLVVAQPPP